MGTTAEKGQRVLQSIAEVQEGINNLGGSLTDQTPFKNFRAELDSIYNNLPKTEYQEGTEINLGVTSKGKLDFDKIYQEVEYIESTGPAYIDTDFIPNTNTKIDIEFETILKGTNGVIFGGEETYNSNCFHLYNTSENFDIGFGSKGIGFATSVPYNLNTKYKFIMDKNGFDVNGTTGTFPGPVISTNSNIFLFVVKRATSLVIDSNAQKRIYYCKLYDNETLVRDLIPCYRKLDNVIGMYDKVNGKFYTNAGTGTFTKGADVGSGFGDIVGYGQIEQESYEGYNLFNLTDYNQLATTPNVSEATITKTKDSIKIVTTNTSGQAGFYSTQTNANGWAAYVDNFNASNTYYLSYDIVATTNCQVKNGFEAAQHTDNLVANQKIRVTTSTSSGGSFICYSSSATTITITNIVISTNSSKTSYEPYVGGIPAPNPSYPQEIEVVRGKNLSTINSISTTGGGYINYSISQLANVTKGEIYTLSVKNNTSYTSNLNVRISVGGTYSTETQGNLVANGTKSYTFTASQSGVLNLNSRLGTEDIENALTEIQLEKGSQATSYLPYNTVEIEERGKNAFAFETNSTKTWDGLDITMNNSSVTINGTSTNTSSVYAYGFNLKPLKLIGTYKLSGYTRGDSYLQLYWKDKNGTIKYKAMKSNPTITFNEGDYLFQLFIFASSGTIMTFNNETFNLQLEEGSTATDYEPYITPKTYQLSLGDKELYKDSFISIENDNVYFNDFYEKKNLTANFIQGNPTNRFVIINDFYNRFDVSSIGYSNIGKVISTPTPPTENGQLYFYVTPTNSILNAYVKYDEMTLAQFNAKIQELIDNGTTPYILLKLAEIKKTLVTDTTLKDQIKALYYSHSFTGTTIITSSGELPLVIKVRALKGE